MMADSSFLKSLIEFEKDKITEKQVLSFSNSLLVKGLSKFDASQKHLIKFNFKVYFHKVSYTILCTYSVCVSIFLWSLVLTLL